MMGRSIQSLIFDFDGLIVDTELPHYQSWKELYESHNRTLPLALWVSNVGMGRDQFNFYDHLVGQLSEPVDLLSIRASRRARQAELTLAQPIQNGVLDYIADAKKMGLRLGVASSSPTEWVNGHLVRLGLDEHFHCVTCGDDVEHDKPDPDVYLATLRALDVYPDQAIALEDSPNGVLAAKRARVYCVAVPNPITRGLPFDQADLVLDSLADLSLGELLRNVHSSLVK